jgi:hypothetical protein
MIEEQKDKEALRNEEWNKVRNLAMIALDV